MTCRAEIFIKTREKTLAVPMQAVVFEEIDDDGADMSMRGGRGGPRFGTSMNLNTSSNVFIYSEGKALKKEVKLGISNDELQEILSGISEGDEIIVGPPRVLAKLKDVSFLDCTLPLEIILLGKTKFGAPASNKVPYVPSFI